VSAVESSRIVGTATILADRDCTAGPGGLVLVITVLVITGLVITLRRAAG
jgi:hypothetical protein